MNFGTIRKFFVVIACLLMALTGRAAAVGEQSVVSLTLADGLVGETVHCVMTDHSGSVWMGTSNGVNAYHGRNLVGFRITDERGVTLAVRDLCEVNGNKIYAATEGGLYQLKKGRVTFEHVLPEVESPVCLLAVGDTLYIGGEQGILIYDGKELKRVNVSVSQKGLDNIVRQFVQGDDGRIWFLGRYDLNSYDPKTGKITQYQQSLSKMRLVASQFAYLGDQRFVVGSQQYGLYLCDLKTGQTDRVSGVGNLVKTVQRAADGSICVATDGSGAYRLEVRGKIATPHSDPRSEKLEVREQFNTEGDGSHCLPSNGVYCYYRDPNGVNWFGFVRYGLSYTYYSGDLFKVFKVGDFSTDGMNVRTCERHGDDIIIGTQNGFYYVNRQTGAHRYVSSEEMGGGHIVNTIKWYEGRFYIGTFDGGLHVFDPQTQQVSRQTFSPLLSSGSIGDLEVGPDGRLWIGCSHGLMIVDDDMVQQHFTEQNSHIVGGLILNITFDKSGNAWLTGRGGCSLYSARSQEIAEPNFPEGFFNTMPWMRGAAGHDGLVFMRTGLQTFYTNEQMTDYGELKLPVTFSDKWCRSFIDDCQGHYFLASERGVFMFDYDIKQMAHFGFGEGLRGDFINDMHLGDEGSLWVATSQGLFYCDLKELKSWKGEKRFKVQLSDIRQGSDLLANAEQYAANDQRQLRLSWNMTSEVLQAEPVLMDYSKQRGRLYEYRVDGGQWQLVEDGKAFYIGGLMMGTHQLEVRLAGASDTVSRYGISVLPSFWAIFELVLFVVAIVLLWLWWRFRKNTKVLLTERDEIEDALLESEELRVKSEELKEEAKYERVKVNEEECADIVKRMKEYLERERVYTNQDLKMKDLADVLHLSAPKLSQVFNLYLGQNYYDFINGYRLEEFKRLISEGEYKRFTITALSEQCGFKKSNFFSTFRKVEGLTPAEYLKKQGVKSTLN